jgi:YHS domain-containing protein
MRLVLIDDRIPDIDNIIGSLTPDTEYRVFDYDNDTISTIQSNIVENYESVAIIQHNYNASNYQFIDNFASSTLTDLATTDPDLESWEEYIAFLVWLKNERGVAFVDLLACNLWANENWKYMIETVRKRNDVYIRASLNITGAGGDFILESDHVDMIGIYFTEQIVNYKYVFLSAGHTARYLKFNFTKRFTAGATGNRFLVGRIFFFNNSTSINSIYTGTSVVVASSTAAAATDTGQYSVSATVQNESLYATSSGIPAFNNTSFIGGPEWDIGSSTTDINITVVIDLSGVATIYGYAFFVNANSDYWGYGSTPKAWTLSKSNDNFSWTQIDSQTRTSYPQSKNAVSFWTHPISSADPYYVAFTSSVPGQPTISSITGGNNALTVYFTAPASNGGSAITAYLYSVNDSTTYTQINTVTTSPFVISTGVLNGTTYNVKIVARNAAGDSIASTNVQGTPFTVPNPPTITSIAGNNNSLTMSFTAPANNGGNTITNYLYSVNGTNYFFMNTTTSPFTITTGVSNGTTYPVTLRARNAAGNSSPSTGVSGTPFTVPDPPTINSIAGNNNSLTVTFTAPTNTGGNTITNYSYSINGTNYFFMNTTTSPFTITTGVLNGTTYPVTLRAQNAAGNSNPSTAVSGTPFTIPDPPTITSIAGNNNSLTVSFTAPANTGGNTITNYSYSINGTNYFLMNTTASPFTITTGVSNGTTYPVTLLARNAAGNSSPSTSVSGTPFTVPDPPTITSIAGNNNSLTVSFTAPANTGGNTITNYSYSINGTNYFFMNTTTSPFTITTDVSNGTTYPVTLLASNAAGNSSPSTSVSGTPFTVPNPPTINSIVGSIDSLTVSFTAPTNNGGNTITNYSYSINGTNYFFMNTTTSPFTITTGVFGVTTYNVTLRAQNSAGNSNPSPVVQGTAFSIPSAPTIDIGNTFSVASGNVRIVIVDTSNIALNSVYYWYSTDGGNVYSNTNIQNNGPAYSPYVFYATGLLNQTYTLSIMAKNLFANAVSSSRQVVSYTTPFPVSFDAGNTLSVASGNLRVVIVDTSNSALNAVYYSYSINGGITYADTGIMNNGPAYSPYVFYIPGLTNQSYTVLVRCNNSVDSSTVSSITKTVYITPSTPVIDISNTISQTSGNLTITFYDTTNSILNDTIEYYYYIYDENMRISFTST